MQGRLSSPVDGRIQAFPTETWKGEFEIAASLGLDCIEWIYEFDQARTNPIATPAGLQAIRAACEAFGIAVLSVCADYFMERRLMNDEGDADPAAIDHLQWLIERAALAGCHHVVLPFVDSSSLRKPGQATGVERLMREAFPIARNHGIELHLETDLDPSDAAALVQAISHPTVRLTLDTGNSAALGFDASAEMNLIADVVGSVHIKDRVRGGGTVPLGEGDADLRTYTKRLTAAGFTGPYILQVARGRTGDEGAWTRNNLGYLNRLLVDAGARTGTA